MTHVVQHLCVLGSRIKALTTEAMLIPTTTLLLCLRYPIYVPIVSVLLFPQVVPHEGIEPVHVCGSLHAAALACLCVVVAHVRQ